MRSWTHARITSFADEGDLATTVDLREQLGFEVGICFDDLVLSCLSFKLGRDACRVNLKCREIYHFSCLLMEYIVWENL